MGNQYSYFDYPEGTNCTYKTACFTRYTAAGGLCLWWYDVITYSRCKNIGHALVRLPMWIVPSIAAPVAGIMATCYLTQGNKKGDYDADKFAYGAMVSGVVLGATRRSGTLGFHSALIFGFVTFCIRDIDHYYSPVFLQKDKILFGQWDSLNDYTMMDDPGPYTGWEDH